MDLALVTAPTGELVTLAEAKLHLRVDFDDDDAIIADMIDIAVSWLDGPSGQLGRCLLEQTWKVYYDYAFPAWRIHLPLCPLIGVDSITYVDSSGATQTLSASVYQVLDGMVASVQPAYGQAWPAPRSQPRAVTITFKAGHAANDSRLSAVRAALKLMIGHLYAHREAVVGVENRDSSNELPLGVERLIAPLRARSVA